MSIISEKLQLYPDIDTVGAFLINFALVSTLSDTIVHVGPVACHSGYLQIIYPA